MHSKAADASCVFFRIVGVVLVFSAAMLLFYGLSLNSVNWHRHPGTDKSLMGYLLLLPIVSVPAVLGIGLYRLRKWAAVVLSAGGVCLLGVLAIDGSWSCIHPVAFIVLLLMFSSPTLATISCWHRMVWRRSSGRVA